LIGRLDSWILGLMLVVGGLGGFLFESYYLNVGTEIITAVIFAMSYNIALGYGGLVSFGHSFFYGLGAYAVAILLRDTSVGFPVAMLVGMVLSGFFGAAIAFVTRRSREVYFAILTMGFSQVAFFIAFTWYNFTQGDNGIFGFDVGKLLSEPRNFYWFTLVMAVIWCAVLVRLVGSPFGLTLRAIRDHEERSKFIGLYPDKHKMIALMVSGVGSGMAGALYAGMSKLAHPNLLHWVMGAQPVLMTLVGGMNSFWGPAIGAVVYKTAEVFLGQVTERWTIVIGVVLLTIALVAPNGLAGVFGKRSQRVPGFKGSRVQGSEGVTPKQKGPGP
jgi:branched-chain amino acid transport system permease protein